MSTINSDLELEKPFDLSLWGSILSAGKDSHSKRKIVSNLWKPGGFSQIRYHKRNAYKIIHAFSLHYVSLYRMRSGNYKPLSMKDISEVYELYPTKWSKKWSDYVKKNQWYRWKKKMVYLSFSKLLHAARLCASVSFRYNNFLPVNLQEQLLNRFLQFSRRFISLKSIHAILVYFLEGSLKTYLK